MKDKRGNVARRRPGRNIVHGPMVGRAAKPRLSLVRFGLDAERIS